MWFHVFTGKPADFIRAMAPERRPPELHQHHVRRRPACQAGAVTGQRHPRRADECIAGNPCGGAWLGASHGHVDQAWRQAGGPAAEQSRRQRLDLLRLLDAVHRRCPHGSGRRAGLDELCGRRAGDDCAVDVDPARARDAPAVEDGGVVDAEGQPAALRVRGVVPAAGSIAGRGERHYRGRSGLCGLQAVLRVDDGVGLRVRDSVARRHLCDECTRRTASGRRVGWRWWPCAAAGGGSGDRRARVAGWARSCAYTIRRWTNRGVWWPATRRSRRGY